MKILLLSFYYPPDLCAGSFRAKALVDALLDLLPEDGCIEVITTLPNRYSSFSQNAPEFEQSARLTIRRIKLPNHKSGMLDQAKAFSVFAFRALKFVRNKDYDIVCATSSRLMTASLGALVSRLNKAPLFLDIRDIFVDTLNDVLPQKIAWCITPFFSLLERWTIAAAKKVNLVSEGFKAYFERRYPAQDFTYHTNGIDPEFMAIQNPLSNTEAQRGALTVLYAGNMGEGQGLHAVIPELAKRFESRIHFRLIGDGGRRSQLERRLSELTCSNVELLPPVKREQLLQEYRNADVLFLHLADYDAFKKVLPSKIFEYAATGKPIWAGVAGYAAKFIAGEIENAAVFYPADITGAEKAFEMLNIDETKRAVFVQKFARSNIMGLMASDIIGMRG